MAYEDAFDVRISDADAVRLRTPRDLVELVFQRTTVAGRALKLEEIERIVEQITIDQLGLKKEQYGLDKRFVEDLRVD